MTDELPRTIGQTVVGKRLVWGHSELVTMVLRSTFVACDIVITCSRRSLVLADCTFRDCSIRAKRDLVSVQFFDSTFENCSFAGRYPGCEFGYRTPVEGGPTKGSLRDCDLSRAILDLVTINSSDPSRIRLPTWPHFTLLRQLAYGSVPELAGDRRWQLLGSIPWAPETRAVVHLYSEGGRRGFSVPSAAARAALSRCDEIRIEGAAEQGDEADER
jgi:hypothetical protein